MVSHPVDAIVFSQTSKRDLSTMQGMNGRVVAFKTCDFWGGIKQSVQGKCLLLPLEASLSSLGFATFPLIDPSLDV